MTTQNTTSNENTTATTDFREIHNTESVEKHTDNQAFKEERARRIHRSLSSKYNADNSITVTMSNGYGGVIGEETFTKDDLYLLAQEKGEKLIDKKISKAKAEERRINRSENFEILCKYIGAYVVGYTGGILAVKVIKKIASIIKR